MTIVLDARMAGHSGIGTYIRGLLSGFSPEQLKEITLVGDPRELGRYPCPVAACRAPIYSLREQWELPRLLGSLKPRLFHAPHYNIPLLWKGPQVATVHDVIHIKFPSFSRVPLARWYARYFLGRVPRRCRRILTDAESTKRDLVALGASPANIRVVPLAVDAAYRPTSPEERKSRLKNLGLTEGYILYVGNLRKIKNIPRLLKAYDLLLREKADAPPLVLAGRDQIPSETAPYRGRGSIRFLGDVPRESLPALYGGAAVFAFPSIYEGFGLPALEAMACGCPVIASASGSLPEVTGAAALTVDPGDTEALKTALGKVLADGALRQSLRERGLGRAALFSWNKCAQETWAVYLEALSLSRKD